MNPLLMNFKFVAYTPENHGDAGTNETESFKNSFNKNSKLSAVACCISNGIIIRVTSVGTF